MPRSIQERVDLKSARSQSEAKAGHDYGREHLAAPWMSARFVLLGPGCADISHHGWVVRRSMSAFCRTEGETADEALGQAEATLRALIQAHFDTRSNMHFTDDPDDA